MRFVRQWTLLFSIVWFFTGASVFGQEESLRIREVRLRGILSSLDSLHPWIIMDYRLNTEMDQTLIEQDLKQAQYLVSSGSIHPVTLDARQSETLDRILLANAWEIQLLRQAFPTEEEKREYYETHQDQFIEPDWFIGSRFLIEPGPEAEEQVAYWKSRLEKGNQSFRSVAREFYRSVGEEKDGYLGRIERGLIREDLFDQFMEADPEAAFFGPVETKNGFLFGKVDQVHEAGPLPYEEIENYIVSLILRERILKTRADKIQHLLEQHDVELLFDDALEAPPPPEQPVYRIGEEVVLHENLYSKVPGVIGDRSRVEFFKAIVDKAIEQDLIRSGVVAEEIRKAEPYDQRLEQIKSLYSAFLTIEARVNQSEPTDEQLQAFYQDIKDEHFRLAPEVRLMIFEVEHNPDNIRNRYRAHLARKAAWENAHKVWEAFRQSEDPDHFELIPFYGTPGLTRRIPLAWRATDRLSQVMAQDIQGKPAGYISPVLIENDKYIFYYITDKRGENRFQPYEEVREEVLKAWQEAKRQRLRNEYGLSFGKR